MSNNEAIEREGTYTERQMWRNPQCPCWPLTALRRLNVFPSLTVVVGVVTSRTETPLPTKALRETLDSQCFGFAVPISQQLAVPLVSQCSYRLSQYDTFTRNVFAGCKWNRSPTLPLKFSVPSPGRNCWRPEFHTAKNVEPGRYSQRNTTFD